MNKENSTKIWKLILETGDYLKDKLPELEKPTTLFWIVGSEPDISFMPIKIVGEKPKKVNNHLDSIYAPEDDWEKIWSGGL